MKPMVPPPSIENTYYLFILYPASLIIRNIIFTWVLLLFTPTPAIRFLPDFTGENQPLVTEENIRYNEEKKMLNVLLSAKIKADEKIKILEEDFQIPMEGERGKVFI